MAGRLKRQLAWRPGSGLPYALAGVTLALLLVSLGVGPAHLGLGDVIGSLLPGADARNTAAALIVREIRLPRALLGLLIGAALGASGAALQGYLRNPLAEPGLIGATGGAALGAVLAIHTGTVAAFALALPLAGLIGAGLAVLLVLALAGQGGKTLTLILAGTAVTSLAGALTSLALNLSKNPFASVEIVFWLMGSLVDRSLAHVALAAPPILIGIALLVRLGRDLDALSLGEDVAASLGVDLPRTRWLIVGGTALAVGAATAVAGMIGFVGLIAPNLLRPLVGYKPSRLVWASLWGGAALVLAADILVRIVSPSGELRLGVVTALIGTPFFIWLVVRMRGEVVP